MGAFYRLLFIALVERSNFLYVYIYIFRLMGELIDLLGAKIWMSYYVQRKIMKRKKKTR
ncbi:hypothetical protein BDC45DRAFT_494980 [Circinella umbellata]|nr:hypothetical protein BDC45DRAFT_494980 [Circinella umbellata]